MRLISLINQPGHLPRINKQTRPNGSSVSRRNPWKSFKSFGLLTEQRKRKTHTCCQLSVYKLRPLVHIRTSSTPTAVPVIWGQSHGDATSICTLSAIHSWRRRRWRRKSPSRTLMSTITAAVAHKHRSFPSTSPPTHSLPSPTVIRDRVKRFRISLVPLILPPLLLHPLMMNSGTHVRGVRAACLKAAGAQEERWREGGTDNLVHQMLIGFVNRSF